MPALSKGLDYSFGRPDLAAVRKAGYTFVVRYLSGGISSKDITTTEAHALEAAGLPFALAFERDSNAPKGGLAAGRADGAVAKSQLASLRLAGLRPVVYAAVDFDAVGTDLKAVVAYVQGFASVVGYNRTGVYGSRAVLDACRTAGACPWFWWTYAWGTAPAYAQLRQVQNGVSVGGASVDVNEAWTADFGQYPQYVAPVAGPSAHQRHLAHLAALLAAAKRHAAHLAHLAHLKRKPKG